MKNHSNYLREADSKLGLYQVEGKFYLVTCANSGYLNINPLYILEHFNCVKTANPLDKNYCPSLFLSQLVNSSGGIYNLYINNHFTPGDPRSVIQTTTVRSISSLPLSELMANVTRTAVVKQFFSFPTNSSISIPVLAFYRQMRQIPEATRFKNSVRLDFMSRLLEPLSLCQAMQLQVCGGLLREAIWRTKWKFRLHEFTSHLIDSESKRLINYM